MFNLVDLVQMKTKIKREQVEEILAAAIEATTENLKEGNDVYWIGLGRFTYKQKAKTKAQAKEWTEYPYMAEGDKVRFVPEAHADGTSVKGSVLKIHKETSDENSAT